MRVEVMVLAIITIPLIAWLVSRRRKRREHFRRR